MNTIGYSAENQNRLLCKCILQRSTLFTIYKNHKVANQIMDGKELTKLKLTQNLNKTISFPSAKLS